MKKAVLLISVTMLVMLSVGSAAFAGSPEPDVCDPKSPGYWKNRDWPVESIWIGYKSGRVFITQEQGQALLDLPVKGNKTITLLKALMAARLNRDAGCDVSCIS
jgi:hypothetical protein